MKNENEKSTLKKVYMDFRSTTLILISFFACAFNFFHSSSPSGRDSFFFCVTSFGLFSAFFWHLVPLFEYDEKGIRFFSFMKFKKFKWSEIESLSGSGYRATITMRTGEMIYMTSFFTRNFFGVLKDVVFLLRKNRSDAKVSKDILKWIAKPPNFYF